MPTVLPQTASWFTYFPEDYRWSSAVCGILGSAPWGGSDIGEVDRACRGLRKQVGDDAAWFEAWRAEGDRVHALAREADSRGRRITAAAAYLRAANYYQMGERFRTPKDKMALEAYREGVDCFQRFARLSERPRIEVVEVPYEGASLPAYFVHAENTTLTRPPCAVFFDGLDITKELQYLRGVPDLVRRGIACLIVDGPGTGEAIRFRGHYLRHDYEVAGRAALDYLATRADVDPQRIGVMAVSLGGYYAPRCAAMEPRFKACIAWGAIWDYYATWKRRIEAGFRASMSVPGHHICWILGVSSVEEALRKLEPFRLDGVVQRMRCPFLLTHGADDEQIPMADARALFEAVGSADKTFRVFTTEEGGSQHCQRDYLTLGTSVMFDWLAEKL
ncbi:MAG TPA: prolyl oligopeptidase family serine peptidase [Methylomirabilota bacterium]|nr:prolyl oligopeptidase family serine peptidase [Methylomirabilota bacterium]